MHGGFKTAVTGGTPVSQIKDPLGVDGRAALNATIRAREAAVESIRSEPGLRRDNLRLSSLYSPYSKDGLL
jgi:hypothetical protein